LDLTVNALTYLYMDYMSKNDSKESDTDTSSDENTKLKTN
jgi:hypothetical protein